MRALLLPLLVTLAASACAHRGAALDLQAPLTTEALSEAGPFQVKTVDLELRRGERALPTTVWYPSDGAQPDPLIIYSHGFMSFRGEGQSIAQTLASHGYVVMAADFPRTSLAAVGGPLLDDVANQPADVSFLVDTAVRLSGDRASVLWGKVDQRRVGVVGVSLGGLTSTLAAFHPTLRDARVGAVVSIAGPSAMLTPDFFATAPVPFLGIYGTVDAIVDYRENGRPLLWKAPRAQLLTLRGGAHTSFADIAQYVFFWLGNPDVVGCGALKKNLPAPGHDPFAALGGPAAGVDTTRVHVTPCQREGLARAMRPGRQQQLTRLAVYAFFESQLHADRARRAAFAEYLTATLPRENEEAVVEGASSPR